MLIAAVRHSATLHLCVAPLIWAAHFLAIYAFAALACARKATAGWVDAVPWFVGAVSVVSVIALLVAMGLAVRASRAHASTQEPTRFMYWLAIAMAALALVAIAWETLPVLLLPVCP